ncbi:MAG: ParB/Srx family N-terminal domain-containing protein [Bryobacteraceae bacterium]|nr:ParB/Srx family N-terminal domain-containing protein [Bryobacteraceae bacterium]
MVDTKAGIIAGHGRLLAAQKLGLQEVPVIILDHLTEAQKRAYVIADNQLATLAGWDEGILSEQLLALQGEDFNLDLLGFDDADLDRLLGGELDGSEDALPETPATAASRLGDVWLFHVSIGCSAATPPARTQWPSFLASASRES